MNKYLNPTAFILISISIIIASSCKKKDKQVDPVVTPPTDTTVVIAPAIDPAIANTIGFFLDDWKPKTFIAPAYNETTVAVAATTTATVDASNIITKVPLAIFGNNAVLWMQPVAGVPAFITPVTNLHPHILRFPGGSASDAYFWNAVQNALPADAPTMLVDDQGVKKNPGYNYGKTNLNWQCTLDNYYTMLQQTNSKGIITVNYGYARYGTSANPVAVAAHLAADWVRYDNGRTELWEIGNENYGNWEWGYRIDQSTNKDGQPEYLTGALYAQHFKVFVDSMQKAATEIGKKIYIGAVAAESPSTESWQTTTRKTWNAGMIPGINNKADFYVIHNYFGPYNTNDNAQTILSAASSSAFTMMDFITKLLQSYGATVKPIAMDEWNFTSTSQMQQVSNISGVASVLLLGELLKNKCGMAARWDLLNGWAQGDDHGMFSNGDEPGGIPRWNPRPSFFYLYYMQKMLGDRLVAAEVSNNPGVKAYGSTFSSGQAGVILVNTTTNAITVEVKVKNFNIGSRFYWYSLQGGTDNGEFSRKVLVNGNGPTLDAGGPVDYATLKANAAVTTSGVRVSVPARGTVFTVIDKK